MTFKLIFGTISIIWFLFALIQNIKGERELAIASLLAAIYWLIAIKNIGE